MTRELSHIIIVTQLIIYKKHLNCYQKYAHTTYTIREKTIIKICPFLKGKHAVFTLVP